MAKSNLLKWMLCIGLLALGSQVVAQKFTLLYDLAIPIGSNQKGSKENLPVRYLRLDPAVLQSVVRTAPTKLWLSVPLLEDQVTTLELERHEVLTDDFKINESGSPGNRLAYEPGVYYRGRIQEIPQSLVAISFFADEVMGTIVVDNTVFSFGKPRASEGFADNIYQLLNENALLAVVGDKSLPAACSTQDDVDANLQAVMDRVATANDHVNEEHTTAALSNQVVRIYFECDNKMYRDRGNSTTATVNYVTALFNVVQTLYANEQVNVALSEVFVWTTADSYSTNSAFAALQGFGNKMKNTPFNGNVAQLLSTNTRNLGGVAWLDVLCDSPFFVSSQGTYVGPFSYANITNTYADFPTYSWTTMVVTHELGHNLGSPHTHSCSWPGGALDNCYCPEGNCGFGAEPTNGGTIMSYCHLTGGTNFGNCVIPSTNPGINLTQGFGTAPGSLIRERVANATCLTSGGSNTCGLSVNPTSLSFAAGAGNQTVSITAAGAWTASDNAAWLTLSAATGSGNGSLIVTVQANTGVARTATVTIACDGGTRTIAITQQASSSCQISTNPTALNYTINGGRQAVALTSSGSWTATRSATWLSLSRSSGSGSADVNITAQSNSGAARTATITFTCSGGGTAVVSVTQAGNVGTNCTLTVSPTTLTYPVGGNTQNISITSSAAWTASDDAAWLTLSSASGTGNATITATATNNTGASRAATITITCGGTTRTISVSQSAASSGCTLTVSPTTLTYPVGGNTQNISITSSAAWTASDDAAWLTLSSASGTGNATITATATNNTGAARAATITITCGGTTRTISVSQSAASSGCTLTVSPTTLTYLWNGGDKTLTISSTGAWNASSSANWITLSSTAGTGNAEIIVTAQNNLSRQRTATITITCGGVARTVNVTQSGLRGNLPASTPNGDFIVAVAPNPVKTELNISWQQPEIAALTLQLFDMHGRLMWEKRYSETAAGWHNEQLSVSHYAPGTYILRLNTPQQPIVQRIVIE